jgi:hypothetical protein
MSKVILSKKTLDVLKNFSSINSSIVFRQGSTVRTISNAENILAKYTAEEIFPVFSDSQLEFANNDFVSILGGGRSVKYYFSDPEITLKSAPEKNVKFPGADIQFNITGDELVSLQKASAVYSLPDLTVDTTGDTIKLILRDKENDTSNTYEQSTSGDFTGSYSLDVKIENIRLLPGDYTVKISKHLISEWTNQTTDLTYYIALEP